MLSFMKTIIILNLVVWQTVTEKVERTAQAAAAVSQSVTSGR